MFSIVNVYLDHWKFCVVCINRRRCVCCGECYVVSYECEDYISCLGCFCIWGELGFLYCDDIFTCIVNNQYEILEFVFNSIYVDLNSNEISLPFTVGSVCLCGVCSHVVILGVSVWFSLPPMWVRCLRLIVFVLHVSMMREC